MLPIAKVGRREDLGALLALDLGSKTGWAVAHQDGAITSGEWRRAPYGSREPLGRRMLRFRQALIETGRENPIRQVVYEEVNFHSSGVLASHLWGAWWGLLLAWCETHRIAYTGVQVKTLKKFFAGDGSADKLAMIAAAEQLGHAPGGDNEADALAAMYWGLEREAHRSHT